LPRQHLYRRHHGVCRHPSVEQRACPAKQRARHHQQHHGTASAGIVLNSVTSPTFGGLNGSKNLASLFNSSTGGYGSVTNVTLNPGTGASHSYSGVIADGATGMTLTKTGAGTQTLTGPNTYTGATTVSAGTLTLGASGVIADSSVVNLNAGTLNTTDGVVESLHSIQATTGTLLLGNTTRPAARTSPC
jgi:autotransporter-associated beta strand protein